MAEAHVDMAWDLKNVSLLLSMVSLFSPPTPGFFITTENFNTQ